MEKIDERWPEGIKEFWSGFDKLGDLGEESGFYPETGRLEICRCYNRQLDESILREREHIRELVIRKNELEDESYEIIARLTNLRKLVLESVGPYILELDVRKLVALTDVRIGSATNTELPDWILMIRNLESLNVSNTRIERFPVFSSYDGYKKWKKLDISYTAISSLPDFNDKLEQLRELRVANTEIKKIPNCYLTNSLRLLDCSNTQISSFKNFKRAKNLEVFLCAGNSNLENLAEVEIDKLQVLDVCQCAKLKSLPEKGYNNIEALAVCGNFFNALPLELLEHCINHELSFKPERAIGLKDLNYDDGLSGFSEAMKGVYIEETFFRKMDFRYLLDNDLDFLRYYIDMERKGKLCAEHETKIMVLGDERGVGDLFMQSLVPEHPQLYYMEYGGLKVLDTAAGELDYMRRKLDSDADISIWTMENGTDEQFMHHKLFSEHDFFIIVLREGEGVNYHERAVYWLKEIARSIQYATIAFAVVGNSAKNVDILNLKEVKQECERKYFRFLNKVYNVNVCDIEEYTGLTDWLVEGIREKSNYGMQIPLKWKRLRGQIVSYLDLRRIINQERLASLLTLEQEQGRRSFVNYLQESKSLFHIQYSGKEDYYFKAEWVISTLFGLLDVLRKGRLPDPFKLDDLRVYLQIERMDYLDFFHDSESLQYLMDILEEIGAVFQISGEYYDLLAQSYMPENSHIFKLLSDSVRTTYKISYSILTEQMALKIIAVLMQEAGSIGLDIDKDVFRYKDCIAFKLLEEVKSKGYLAVKIITGCPGKVFFYGVVDSETGNMKSSVQRKFREHLRSVIRSFLSDPAFSLWQSEVFVLYEVNGMEDFVSMQMVERYVKAGYAFTFLPQYNASIDIDEVDRNFGI